MNNGGIILSPHRLGDEERLKMWWLAGGAERVAIQLPPGRRVPAYNRLR